MDELLDNFGLNSNLEAGIDKLYVTNKILESGKSIPETEERPKPLTNRQKLFRSIMEKIKRRK